MNISSARTTELSRYRIHEARRCGRTAGRTLSGHPDVLRPIERSIRWRIRRLEWLTPGSRRRKAAGSFRFVVDCDLLFGKYKPCSRIQPAPSRREPCSSSGTTASRIPQSAIGPSRTVSSVPSSSGDMTDVYTGDVLVATRPDATCRSGWIGKSSVS